MHTKASIVITGAAGLVGQNLILSLRSEVIKTLSVSTSTLLTLRRSLVSTRTSR